MHYFRDLPMMKSLLLDPDEFLRSEAFQKRKVGDRCEKLRGMVVEAEQFILAAP